MLTSLVLFAALTVSNPIVPPPVTLPAASPIQTGVDDSAYHGKFFRKSQETKRKCIVQRESNGHYFSTARKNGYFGAYQMTRELGVGAGWMMRGELRDMFGFTVGTEIARVLRETEPQKWNRFYQDMAFFTIANWKGDGTGFKHWRGGRWVC